MTITQEAHKINSDLQIKVLTEDGALFGIELLGKSEQGEMISSIHIPQKDVPRIIEILTNGVQT